MVDEIARDIAEMLAFSTGTNASAAGTPDVDVAALATGKFELQSKLRDNSAKHALELNHYFWAPENYTPWVQALLAAWKIQPPPKSEVKTDLPEVLATPEMSVLLRESLRVSALLTKEPLNARAHEEAALITASLALREAAGRFADTRRLLCRTCAHLALAQALDPKEGPCGELAGALLLTLAGRQEEALAQIATWSPERGPWARALRLRNNIDWHEITDIPKASLLEQFEYARSIARNVRTAKLQSLLKSLQAQDRAEWHRIVMEQPFTVETGHAFVSDSLQLELQEFVQCRAELTGSAPDAKTSIEDIVKFLNEPAARAVTRGADSKPRVEVLSWGALATFHQRHICHSMTRTACFLNDLYSSLEDGAEFTGAMEKNFRALTLYPLARCDWGKKASTALPEAAALCEKHPDLVTAGSWVKLGEVAGRAGIRVPNPLAWFNPVLPTATVYDYACRYYDLHEIYKADLKFWDDLIAMAPFHYDVLRTNAYKRYGAALTPEQSREAFASISNYHLLAMREISDTFKTDPAAYEQHMRKIAGLDPDRFIQLGKYFVERKMPEQAAEAFQSAFDQADDRVAMANNSRWIVLYYFEHDRKDDALKIAEEAAEVYSYGGLETMGELQERMGQLDQAEKYFANILERYDDSAPLVSLYERQRASNPKFAARIAEMEAQVFPKGIEKTALDGFNGPPADGVLIKSESDLTRQAGIYQGNVIVAVDGVRVHGQGQYIWQRQRTNDPQLTLIVWNGSQYVEIKASPPDRKFNCDIGDYQEK